MKFSKEFTSQMVPEWQGAYLDYSFLKSLLKDYQIFKEQNKINYHGSGGGPGGGADGLTRALSIYKPFGGLLTRSLSRIGSVIHRDNHHHHHHHHHHHRSDDDIEEQVILEVKSKEGSYQTKFMVSSDDGGEYELMFFKRLDDEFNKVNNFYKDKVEEVMKEAALLNKQMDALIAFRIKVHNPDGIMELHHDYHNQLVDMKAAEAHHIEGLMPPVFTPAATAHGAAQRAHMDAIEESELSGRGYSDTYSNSEEGSSRGISDEVSTSAEDTSVIEKTIVVNLTSISEEKPKQLRARRPTPLKILDNVKINKTVETPRSTIKGILKLNNSQELSFGKDNLKKVEEQLKDAFIHFHHKLELLKSYSFVNLSAVFHIMKKYDKITGRNASKPYLHMVDNSDIGNSDDVTDIMERVEAAFIKHFSNSNHDKGMKILKPKIKRQKHRTSFSTGFFTGGSVALLVSLILLIRARDLVKSKGGAKYMETMFPLYSLFGFIILHMLLFAGNIYFWRRYRVNYPFIFGLKKGKDIGYREILLLSAGLSTFSLAAVLANLDMDVHTKNYKMLTELVPLALVSLIILIMFCPFNIIYRSTRFYFLTRALHCTLAPLYKVSLPDMFFADQISSQAQALRSLGFYICYYGRGDFKTREISCKSNSAYVTFYFIFAALGFWWRFLQCLRRYFEEKDRIHGYNAMKYFSIIVAICLRIAYTKQPTMAWLVLAWISSIGATLVATWWDIVIDWGLFQRKSKNPWLRDKLLVSHKSVYFVAIAYNIFGRFAWIETVLGLEFSFLHKEALIAIVQSIEIIRRGSWNFFRLENEHLNNVGLYRAFRSVPLPFNYDEGEESL